MLSEHHSVKLVKVTLENFQLEISSDDGSLLS